MPFLFLNFYYSCRFNQSASQRPHGFLEFSFPTSGVAYHVSFVLLASSSTPSSATCFQRALQVPGPQLCFGLNDGEEVIFYTHDFSYPFICNAVWSRNSAASSPVVEKKDNRRNSLLSSVYVPCEFTHSSIPKEFHP